MKIAACSSITFRARARLTVHADQFALDGRRWESRPSHSRDGEIREFREIKAGANARVDLARWAFARVHINGQAEATKPTALRSPAIGEQGAPHRL